MGSYRRDMKFAAVGTEAWMSYRKPGAVGMGLKLRGPGLYPKSGAVGNGVKAQRSWVISQGWRSGFGMEAQGS